MSNRVELLSGQVVAVKKLHALEEEISNERSFTNEIQALTKIRLRNILKLNGFCSRARRIVHRDIKCNNILLDMESKAYFSDFDSARNLQQIH